MKTPLYTFHVPGSVHARPDAIVQRPAGFLKPFPEKN